MNLLERLKKLEGERSQIKWVAKNGQLYEEGDNSFLMASVRDAEFFAAISNASPDILKLIEAAQWVLTHPEREGRLNSLREALTPFTKDVECEPK